MLKGTIDLAFHRPADVRRDLELAPGASESPHGQVLLADVALQGGKWAEARRGYETRFRADGSWDALARLAHLERQLGSFDLADRLYAEAADELTAKQMRSYAWVKLQRGLLDLARGRYDAARAHYERASRAYRGHWLLDQHVAGLLAIEGRSDEAVAVYERVVECVPRPELHQALGDLYEHLGRPEAARRSRDLALAAYLDSTRRGRVHYFHHLVDLYADTLDDGPEAVRWAREDVRLRDGPSTRAALGWTLYRNGEVDEALAETRRALGSGFIDAGLFRRAALIHEAAGRNSEAQELSRRAAEIDPHDAPLHRHG